VCAFISPKNIYIANCGDSRAVLCRSGNPVFSTRDHKPGLSGEKERIQKAGGCVVIQRVNGLLAVSRALGDYEYKKVEGRGPCEQLVSPEPEIFVRERDDEQDEFLVLACDGIWDVMNNESLCNFIHSRLLITDDLEAVSNQVIDTCLYKVIQSFLLIIRPIAVTGYYNISLTLSLSLALSLSLSLFIPCNLKHINALIDLHEMPVFKYNVSNQYSLL
jgi:protein phosphatase 1B